MDCDVIHSGCAEDNIASFRVMEKAGMTQTARDDAGGWLFEIDRKTFLG